MRNSRFALLAGMIAGLGVLAGAAGARAEDLPSGPPDAVLDLRTAEGAKAAQAVWRYSDAQLREVDFRAAGPDHKPSGPPNRTHTLEPLAGATDFDDSKWAVLDPTALEDRHGTGKVSFAWYRLHAAIPAKIGGFETAGATVVFETVVDDYAEVWVNGALPFDLHADGLGQSGGAVIAGWNMPNRRLITASARPGERAIVAIFAANGPISNPPSNYIWIRRAQLAFYKAPRAVTPARVDARIERLDPALDRAVPRDARVEKLAEGFAFTEGPVWVPEGAGFLLFSDPNRNRIYRYDPAGGGSVSVFRGESGYQGPDIGEYGQPGSNGLALDPRDGALTIDEHGNRRVAKLAADGTETAIADRYRGARLNSPNDLVYRSDGTLYFTDPPFGLPKFHDDPRRELPYTGVYKLDAKRSRAGQSGPHRPERHRLLARREVPVRHELGHRQEGGDALRGRARRLAGERPRVLRHGRRARRRGARRPQGGRARQPLRVGPRRRVDPLARGKAHRPDRRARAARELRLGRRRPEDLCT